MSVGIVTLTPVYVQSVLDWIITILLMTVRDTDSHDPSRYKVYFSQVSSREVVHVDESIVQIRIRNGGKITVVSLRAWTRCPYDVRRHDATTCNVSKIDTLPVDYGSCRAVDPDVSVDKATDPPNVFERR